MHRLKRSLGINNSSVFFPPVLPTGLVKVNTLPCGSCFAVVREDGIGQVHNAYFPKL